MNTAYNSLKIQKTSETEATIFTTGRTIEVSIFGSDKSKPKENSNPTTTVPDWIELIPAGPAIIGIDGRQWNNDTPERIVSAFTARIHPMVVDYEHASEHRAPQGLDAPAAGWIDRLEIRAGAIWGHVEWTAQARQRIEAREYRFISPVFTFEKASSRIAALQSAALTNQPNLNLTALNHRGSTLPILTPEEKQVAYLFGRTEADALQIKQAEVAVAQNAQRLYQQMTPDERRICELMGTPFSDYLSTRNREKS